VRICLLVLAAAGAVGAQSPVRFTDVAAAKKVHFTLENHPTPRKHLIETMPGGVAAFDYDADGWTDIFFTNGAAIPSLEKESPRYWNRLFRNLEGKQFLDVTAQAGVAGAGYSMGAAAGDFDNDGDADLFMAGVFRNILHRNEGDGKFTDVTRFAGRAAPSRRSPAWGRIRCWKCGSHSRTHQRRRRQRPGHMEKPRRTL
jgi:hypothetical protein